MADDVKNDLGAVSDVNIDINGTHIPIWHGTDSKKIKKELDELVHKIDKKLGGWSDGRLVLFYKCPFKSQYCSVHAKRTSHRSPFAFIRLQVRRVWRQRRKWMPSSRAKIY